MLQPTAVPHKELAYFSANQNRVVFCVDAGMFLFLIPQLVNNPRAYQYRENRGGRLRRTVQVGSCGRQAT
jgi:hypothetical protein